MSVAPRPRAILIIPQAWLSPNLTLDAVRSLQRGDTRSELNKGDLHLDGVEVLVARNWILEEFWPRIQDTVQRGYPAEKTYTFLRVQGERRHTKRSRKS